MSEARYRILVAEDDTIVRQIIVDTLDMCDFDLIQAASGHEALRLINKPDGVDLLITDLKMPGMDGIELAYHVRGLYPQIPVLLVSAWPSFLKEGFPPEPYQYIPKPFRLRELTKTVSDLLAAR